MYLLADGRSNRNFHQSCAVTGSDWDLRKGQSHGAESLDWLLQ
jgi:hypothetical protein